MHILFALFVDSFFSLLYFLCSVVNHIRMHTMVLLFRFLYFPVLIFFRPLSCSFNFADEADNNATPGFKRVPVALPGGPVPGTVPGTVPDPSPRAAGAHGSGDCDGGGGAGDGREAASPGARRGGDKGGASPGASAATEGGGKGLKLSPGAGLPRVEAVESAVSAG